MNAIPPAEALDLERLRYWQGQMLRSRDFRDQRSFDEQLRWWHSRAMHQAYGVAHGFALAHKKGAELVEVGPGRAYDWFGRELILFEKRTVSIPKTDAELALLVRYKDPRNYRRKAEIGTACLPGGGSLFREDVDLVWKAVEELQPKDGVLLARIDKDKDELRRQAIPARALSKPRMATGTTMAGATLWEEWRVPRTERGVPQRDQSLLLGAQVTVDTSAAGFSETPCYFAWLQRQAEKSKNPEVLVDYYWEHIASASVEGFVFRVLPRLPTNDAKTYDRFEDAVERFLSRRSYQVNWLAIQCEG